MIRATCPQCANEQECKDYLAGMTVRCKSCNGWIAVPGSHGEGTQAADGTIVAGPAPLTPSLSLDPLPSAPKASPAAITVVPAAKEAVLEKPKPPAPDMEERDPFCRHCGTVNQVVDGAGPPSMCRKCSRPLRIKDESERLRPTRRFGMNFATVWQRVAAALLDNLILGFPYPLACAIRSHDSRLIFAFMALTWVAVISAFNIFLLTVEGQTFGKRAMGIRIVLAEDGSNAGFVTAVLVRGFFASLLYLMPCAGQVLWLVSAGMLFGASRQTVHDHLAGTIVVAD